MIKGYFKDKLYNNEQKLIKELLLKNHNFCGIQFIIQFISSFFGNIVFVIFNTFLTHFFVYMIIQLIK
jgi:hypothetical protein